LVRCQEAVEVSDISLNSDVATVHRLGEAASALGKVHKVVLMVDMGDLREGVLPENALSVAGQMASAPGIQLVGVGTNWGCYGGLMPDRPRLEALVDLRLDIQRMLGISMDIVSGGNSTNINMLLDGSMPGGITELRLGESILLGTEATQRQSVPGCRQDAFTLKAEVIEVLAKPSKPIGKIGQNAFGVVPELKDRGIRMRAICAVGRQDLDPDALEALDPGVSILGASSDHLILDVDEAENPVGVGSVLSFRPAYSALLRAFTSPFVEKVVVSQ
jgi:predicted amino acid racemase